LKALTLTSLGGFDALAVVDIPEPTVHTPDDVLIRIHTAALNHLDLFVLDGLPGVEYTFPHVMLADGAGVVEAVGERVRHVAPGDRVMVNPGVSCYRCDMCLAGEQSMCRHYGLLGEHRSGTAAELIAVPGVNVVHVPEAMPWPEAAAYSLVTLTAWRMLTTRARLGLGETVLIWGIGGGVALAALAIAKRLGAMAIVTSSSDAKLERARALGADYTLNHVTQDVAREVRSLTDRRGADVVVDNVGEATWGNSLRTLSPGGRLVTCGGTSGPMVTTDVRRLFWYQWNIMGSTMGNYAEYQEIARLAGDRALWPVIDRVVPLEEGADAFRRMAGGDQFGKLVLQIA